MRISSRSTRGGAKYISDDFTGRRKGLLVAMMLAMSVLVGRAAYLQIFNKDFLQDKGDLQHVGVVPVSAYRGQIKDRNGEPLAISTPVQSIWVNPRQLKDSDLEKIGQMAKILSLPEKELRAILAKEADKRFMYLKRQINPAIAEKVKALEITGVYFEREFKRYYPAGAVSGHLFGFTNIDYLGQEGMEHGY
jgi:cell division protein FtsI (penicillin-binding protein 3)